MVGFTSLKMRMPLNRCEPKEGVGPGMSVQTVLQQSETSRKMQILFFPNGSCKSLKRTECVRHMCDFAQNRIFSECSIQKVYEKNKLKILRLYLCTGAGRTIRQTRHLPGAPGPIEGFWGPQIFYLFFILFFLPLFFPIKH